MDWNSCVVCGNSDGGLICPAERPDAEKFYNEFLKNVQGFKELDKLPSTLVITGYETAEDFIKHSAKWHQHCRLKYASSKLTRTRERHERAQEETEPSNRKSRRRSSGVLTPTVSKVDLCIFCEGSDGMLHNCSTFNINMELRDMATKLQDTALLSRIAGGDLAAIEAKYHSMCMLRYKNRFRSFERGEEIDSNQMSDQLETESRVFAELVYSMKCGVENGKYIFKLCELHALYEERLRVVQASKTINRSRLKTRILNHFSPECQEQTDGKNTLLIFNEGMRRILKQAVDSRDLDEEAISTTRVCNSIRADMFNETYVQFDGSFPQKCEETSVPMSLKYLVSLLLYGPNITD